MDIGVQKRIFLAQYFYQRVLFFGDEEDVYVLNGTTIEATEKTTLLLIPLSDITDKDAIEVAIQNRYRQDAPNEIKAKVGRDILDRIFNKKQSNMCLPFECADYLRLKGYALSWMNYSVEEMIELGWIKLKTISE